MCTDLPRKGHAVVCSDGWFVEFPLGRSLPCQTTLNPSREAESRTEAESHMDFHGFRLLFYLQDPDEWLSLSRDPMADCHGTTLFNTRELILALIFSY